MLLYVVDVDYPLIHVLSHMMRAVTFSRYVICSCDNRRQNSWFRTSFPATCSRIDVVQHSGTSAAELKPTRWLTMMSRGVVISSPRVTGWFFCRHMLGKKLNDWEFREIVCNFCAKDVVNGQKVVVPWTCHAS